jgi:hypothetical protein
MAKNGIQALILAELQDLKKELREVRQVDIPSVHVKFETFNQKIKTLDKQQTWAVRIYTIVGGAIAVGISMLTGHKS